MTARLEFVNLSAWQTERGFSQAVRIEGADRWLLLSGVGSEARNGVPAAPGDAAEQCRQAWASIQELLAAEGAGVRNIARVRTYVTDPRYLPEVTAVRKEVFGEPPYPLHTFLVVSQLAQPGMLIEIEIDAVL